MSTKRGASKLVKGTVRGTFNRVKSIRNFASDFKEALKTTDADDWATALGGSLLDSSDEEDNAADTRRRHDVEMATSSGRRRKARFYDEREEEKEEIEPIAEEHTETSRGDAEELANLWSLKSVA
ncbi:expressed unknown protein [Seminavis robusta]|uniref:Uncharacterized protein n=1 Tax=Seminavis robusta TaxID=568900 RepID=A0A9N8H9G0_9STRA|nr:expressed unknown protein [Seminavis robusta]|eukprot:Sro204_g086060.1 n/a (125) ;mRNA; r:92099-92473